MFDDLREADVFRRPQDGRVVLEDNAVLDDRHAGRNAVGPVFFKDGSRIDDVVHIPFAWFAHRVDQRRGLFVDAARLPVDIRLVVIAIQKITIKAFPIVT